MERNAKKAVLLQLEDKDIHTLIKGVSPSYEEMTIPLVKRMGRYSGSYGTWTWVDGAIEEETKEDLINLYLHISTKT